jgi:hypothetical protein
MINPTHKSMTPETRDLYTLPVEKKSDRLIAAALKEAYRLHAPDKITRQATKRFLR